MATSSRTPRVLLIVAGALVALVAIVWGALVILLPPPRVRALVQQQLSTALTREVRFEGAGVSLFPPVRLNVSNFALAEPGGFANGAAVRLNSIGLDLDVMALLGGKIRVRRLVLDQPALHLLMRADGTTNFDGLVKEAPPSRTAPKPMDLDIRELQVKGGKVLVDAVKDQRRIALDLDTKLSFQSEGGGKRIATDGTTHISNLAYGPLSAARLADLNLSLAKLDWQVEHAGKFDADKERLALTRLALQFGRTEVALTGIVDHPGPRAALSMQARGANVDLGEVLGFLAAADAQALNGIKGGGRLDFDLKIVGAVGSTAPPGLDGTLRVREGKVQYPGAPAAIERIAFTAQFAHEALAIEDFAARVSNQPVKAQLHVSHFADPNVRLAVQGNVDIGAIAPMFAPKDTKLAGRANVDVRASGRAKDAANMRVEGRAKLTDVSIESPSLPKKLEALHGDLAFSESRAQVSGFGAKAGQSSFALDGTVQRPLALMAAQKPDGSYGSPPADVQFKFRSPYLDVAEIMPVSNGAPMLPNARGGGDVSIGRLKNGALDVKNVAADVTLAPAVLGVPRFTLDGYGGKVGGNAKFDLTSPKQPAFAVKAKVDTVSADALLSAWTPAKGLLAGALSTDIDLSGAGATPADIQRTLTAVGLAGIANGQLGPGKVLEAIGQATRIDKFKEVKFKDGHVPFRVERGRVVTDPVKLSGPYGDWQLIGAIGFDGALDYAVSITLPAAAAQALQAKNALAAGALSDAQGRMLLDLRVTGTAKAPRVTWDPSAMKARLMGRASEAIAEQRQKLESQAQTAIAERQQQAADSARAAFERARARAADSLKSRARDALKGFFGGGAKKDSGGP